MYAFDIDELTLVPSSGGVFDVQVDSDVIFSKKAVGRHAEDGEVLAALQARRG